MRPILLTTLSLVATSSVAVAQQQEKPNVLFILVDDLGAYDLNFLGQKELHTPNVDRLASQGVYFDNAYAAAPVSSPTRASIVSGQSPAEVKITCHIPGIGTEKYINNMSKGKRFREADFRSALELEHPSIADVMKSAGYKTAFFGKWHLAGDGSYNAKTGVVDANYHPDKFGYDINIGGCAYGQPASYFSPYMNLTIEDGEDGEYLTDRLASEAISYMTENQGDPMFLFLSFYSVHTPYQVPEDVVERNGGNKYHAMIEKMDENVGRVLNAVEELGLSEDTIIFFYSDNGGLQKNPPISGIKGDLLEGGIRVPMIAKWAGKTKAGTVCSEPVTSIDVFPTLAEISGQKKSVESPDPTSRSLYSIVAGEGDKLKSRSLYWHFPHHRAKTEWSMGSAIRNGDYKLIHIYETEKTFLFNLKEDPKELNNLAEADPRRTAKMFKELNNWIESVDGEMPVENK
ncbi:MAG: sulfatase [Rikenellaceae bacterium]